MAHGIVDLSKNLVGIKQNTTKLRKDEFWALDNINFELRRGEALGLIGVNGSGKTTLLRLLAGIFPPDKGEIMVNGRVGALIAVGAGFHPHMTGRENIYLNGTILGMTRKEIDSKFEDIVEFAEIGDFLDAPVSTYSSGMRMRLGFSIAIAVKPSFLLIDEMLAVGDLRFRTKCLNQLNHMKKRGVSFILVSHNMTNIIQFTARTIWLVASKLAMDGPSLDTVSAYVRSLDDNGKGDMRFGEVLTDHPALESAWVKLTHDRSDSKISELFIGQNAVIRFCFKVREPLISPNVSFPIYYESGLLMTTVASVGKGITLRKFGGAYTGAVRIGPINFNPGHYFMVANFHDGPEHLFRSVVVRFRVKSNNKIVTWGLVDLNQEWQIMNSVS